jgi:hypothetical protein
MHIQFLFLFSLTRICLFVGLVTSSFLQHRLPPSLLSQVFLQEHSYDTGVLCSFAMPFQASRPHC